MATYHDSTAAAAFGSSYTPTLPAITTGDRLLVFLSILGTPGAVTVTTPAGWTLFDTVDRPTADSVGDRARLLVYTKIAGASETAPTFTFSGSANYGGSMASYSTSSFIDNHASSVTNNATNNTAGQTTNLVTGKAGTRQASELAVLYAFDDMGQIISSGDTGYTRRRNTAGLGYLGDKAVAARNTTFGGDTLVWSSAADSTSYVVSLVDTQPPPSGGGGGATAPSFRAASNVAVAARTTIAPAAPTGLAVGDAMLLVARVDTPKTLAIAATGWRQVASGVQATDGWQVDVWRAVYNGSNLPTVTWDGTSINAGCVLAAYQGADQTEPMDNEGAVLTTDGFDTSSPVGTGASLQVFHNNALLVAILVNANGAGTTPSAGWTERYDDNAFELADQTFASAGTPAQPTFTYSVSARTQSIMVALGAAAGKTQNIGDTVTLADAISNGANKVLSDNPALADALAMGPGKTIADAPALADALSLGTGKVIADTAALADALSLGPGKSIVDTVALADALGMGVGKALADAPGLADSLSTIWGHGLNLADAPATADALNFEYGPGLSEAIPTNDAVAFTAAYQRALADIAYAVGGIPYGWAPYGVGPYGGAELSFDQETHLADAAPLADSVATSAAFVALLADLAGLVDSIATQAAYGRALADQTGLLDDVVEVLGLGRQLNIDDVLALADDLGPQLAYQRVLADAVSVGDAVDVSHGWRAFAADALNVTDEVLFATDYARDLGDGVVVIDTVIRKVDYQRVLTDIATVADAVDFKLRFVQVVMHTSDRSIESVMLEDTDVWAVGTDHQVNVRSSDQPLIRLIITARKKEI